MTAGIISDAGKRERLQNHRKLVRLFCGEIRNPSLPPKALPEEKQGHQPAHMYIEIEGPCSGKGRVCEPILRALPAWFGIEASIVRYTREIDDLPTWLACETGRVLGFISIKQHSPFAAEFYVMGLYPGTHRQGLGRALTVEAEQWLKDRGVEYLQVKTLGPSAADANYVGTRAFYQAMGFRPLEELKQIWDENNPCLIMVKRL